MQEGRADYEKQSGIIVSWQTEIQRQMKLVVEQCQTFTRHREVGTEKSQRKARKRERWREI